MTAVGIEAVVIGGSAGALEALSVVLSTLPSAYPLPVIVVLHMPPGKNSALVELFRLKCGMKVKEAEDKEPLEGGTIYFAPPNYHLLIEKDKTLSLSSDEPVLYSRPSINVLFETAADAYGPSLIGVILTGANQDGADGMKAVAQFGGKALVQRPADAFAPAMPEATSAVCPDATVLSLDEIAVYLQGV